MDTLASIGFKADTSDLIKADKALDSLERSAAATESQVKQTSAAMTSMGGAAAAQSSGVMKMIASLDDQVATLGMTNKELLLYRAAQHGATQADKQAILASIRKIEAFERATLATRAQASATQAAAMATNQMSGSLGQGRMIMQSFGYQIQDTIVQAQMGANAFLILSQQGSQFASAFGPGGAIAGALIALAGVAGMVLAPSLMDSKTEAEKLTAQMDKLGEAAQRNEAGVLVLTEQITELAKQSKVAADSQLQIEILKAEKAMKQASLAAVDMIDSLTGAGDFLNDTGDAFKYVGTNLEAVIYQTPALNRVVREIGEKFGATGIEARDLGVEILKSVKAMGEVKDPAEISKIRDSLIGTARAAKLTDDQLIQFIGSINEYASGAITASEAAALFNKAIGQDNTDATKSATDKMLELTQQTALAKEEFINGEVAATKLALAFELGLKSASELTPELSKQVEELVKWKNASSEAEKAARKLEEAKKIALRDDENEYVRITKALEDMEQASIDAQEAEMERIDKALEGMNKQNGSVDSLYDSVMSLGGAWNSAGSAMIDAFGSAADIMDDYIKRVETISSLEVKLKAARDDSSASAEDRAKAELGLLELQYQGQRANLSMLGKTAGAAASLFKEQSKERKALHAMERAFAVVEIALSLQKGYAAAAAGAAKFFEQSGWFGFAGVAAMAGVLGGMGLSVGGGGGGSYSIPESGTGTVTGDSSAQSSSIGSIQDEYKDIALDQLAELQGIRESMSALSNGIAGLALSLLRSSSFGGGDVGGLGTTSKYGAPSFMNAIGAKFSAIDPLIGVFDGILNKVLGGISKTTKNLLDSGIKFDSQSISDIMSGGFEGLYYNVIETTKKKLWGLSKKTTVDSEFSDVESGILKEIGAIFGYLADSVTGAVDLLGVDAAKAIESFVVNLGSVSFKDMSGEEIQKELEAMFSQQGDLMALYVLPQIEKYQQMGEGALETLLRVSKEQAVFNDGIDKIGQSLGSLSNIMRVDVAQSIITMMGGLESFNSAVNQYFEDFFSESEQLAQLTSSLTEAMSSLGYELPASRDGFRALVDSLDLTTAAGQQAFAMLMQLVPGMDEYLKALEDATKAAEDAAAAAEKEAEAKAKALASQGLDLQLRLYDALGQSSEALALRRQMELEATDESLRALLLQIYAAQDAAVAQQELADSIKAASDAAKDAVQNAFGKLQEAANAEIEAAGRLLDEKLSAIESERAALVDMMSIRQAAADDARAALERSIGAEKQSIKNSADLEKAGIEAALALKIAGLSAERDVISEQAKTVADAYSEQLSVAKSYANSIGSIKEQFDSLFSSMASGETPMQKLTNIYRSVMKGNVGAAGGALSALDEVKSFGGFSSAFEQSKSIAIALNQVQGIGGAVNKEFTKATTAAGAIEILANQQASEYESQIAKIDEQIASAKESALAQLAAIDLQVEAQYAQLDALMGVDEAVLSVADALAQFNAAMSHVNESAMASYDEQLAALMSREKQAQEHHDQTVSEINMQLATAEKQLNALLGVDDRLLTIDEALAEFYAAMDSANLLQLDVGMEQISAINAVEDAVIGLGEQLVEYNKPDDRIWLPPMPVEPSPTTSGITSEMIDLLKELVAGNESIAKHTKTSADALELNQYELQEAAV